MKPFGLMQLPVDVSVRKRIVQVVSLPLPNGTIMVRMVPGEPTTMIEMPVANLLPLPSSWNHSHWLHVARVNSLFSFPEDMLRREHAFLWDHTIHEFEVPRQKYTGKDDDKTIIYKINERPASGWNYDRWQSFSCDVQHLYSRNLLDPENPVVK